MRDLVDKYNLLILKVPTNGDGTIHANPKMIAGRDLADYDLASYVDILDDHNGKLKANEPIKYSRWIFGDESTKFAASDSDIMIAKAIDPNKKGNEGLTNNEKMRLRRESALLFQFLQSLTTVTSFKTFRLQRHKYTYTLEEDEKMDIRCGLTLWLQYVTVMYPKTKISTYHLEKKLTKLTMEGCGNNVTTLFTAMEDLRHRIEAEKGAVYDVDHYITGLFTKIQGYKQDKFIFDVCLKKKAWQRGNRTITEIINNFQGSYRKLVEDSTWTKMDSSQEQIIALTTQATPRWRLPSRIWIPNRRVATSVCGWGLKSSS